MYFLVYIDKRTASSGAGGVIAAIALTLGLGYLLALMGFSWVTGPVSSWMLMEQLSCPGWVLPVLAIAGLAVNFVFCRGGDWQPVLIFGLTGIVCFLLAFVGCITGQAPWYYYLLLPPVFMILGAVIFYPYMWLVLTVTSLPMVFFNWKYAVAGLCCLVGLAAGVIMLNSLGGLIFGMLDVEVPLTMHHFCFQFIDFVPKIFGMEPSRELIQQTGAAWDGVLAWLNGIPLVHRFIVSAVLCVLGTAGEWILSEKTA